MNSSLFCSACHGHHRFFRRSGPRGTTGGVRQVCTGPMVVWLYPRTRKLSLWSGEANLGSRNIYPGSEACYRGSRSFYPRSRSSNFASDDLFLPPVSFVLGLELLRGAVGTSNRATGRKTTEPNSASRGRPRHIRCPMCNPREDARGLIAAPAPELSVDGGGKVDSTPQRLAPAACVD
jgi:hypothetical protein